MENPYEAPRECLEEESSESPGVRRFPSTKPGLVSRAFAVLLGAVGVPITALGLLGMSVRGLNAQSSPDDVGLTVCFVATGAVWAFAARALWRGRKEGWLLAAAPVPIFFVVALAILLWES